MFLSLVREIYEYNIEIILLYLSEYSYYNKFLLSYTNDSYNAFLVDDDFF